MFMRGRRRPSKPASVMGVVVGGLFIVLGVTQVMPMAGGFGIIWTLMAVGITATHAFNLFSKGGVATDEVEFKVERTGDFEERLRKLERLRQDGLLTEQEYQQKRTEILGQQW